MLNPDFLIYTDGSGHGDGIGGYAAFVKTADGLVTRFCMGAASETSVDRSEFMGFLEGLRLALEMWEKFPNSWVNPMSDNPILKKPKICWYSDRENLVLSVKKVYSRSNCPSLWAAFEYYEKLIVLEAHHITEPDTETIPEFVEVDRQSSTGREIMKHYYRETPLHVDYKLTVRKKKTKED